MTVERWPRAASEIEGLRRKIYEDQVSVAGLIRVAPVQVYPRDAASVLCDPAILKTSLGEIEPRGPVKMRW